MHKIRTPRELARERTIAEIMRLGREQVATRGAAALSLRAVAKDLGIVSSAVYRYVSSRDELLTLLVVEAYTDLGDAVDAALERRPGSDVERFVALAGAVRNWAVAEPSRYGLLYGTPVPGYQAPPEETVAAGTRVVVRLMGLVEDAWNAGRIAAAEPAGGLPTGLASDMEGIRAEYGLKAPAWLVARGLGAWSGLFGAVGFEVFGQYGPDTLGNPAELFDLTARELAAGLGLAG